MPQKSEVHTKLHNSEYETMCSYCSLDRTDLFKSTAAKINYFISRHSLYIQLTALTHLILT